MPTTLLDLELELQREYGHVLPPTLVHGAVLAAWAGRDTDPLETARTARADVSALAHAALRAPARPIA